MTIRINRVALFWWLYLAAAALAVAKIAGVI